ncbi:MFS transporter [Candidatus Gribaldobacteria bacterium]|nr:MFS transporter [Candidatus Gribaldobacteria bacterium]
MLKAINKVIKIMVLSDMILLFGWGLIGPVFAVFILKNIQQGSALVAGVSAGIYWLLKSLAQIPLSKFLDKTDGERDDFYVLFFGLLLAGLVPLGYLLVKNPWQLYLLQAFYALTMALVVPAWCGIFTRHIDKGKEAFSWSIESAGIGIGAGVAGILGGVAVNYFGFRFLFIVVSCFTFLAAFILLLAKKNLFTQPRQKVYPLPKP